MQNIERRRRQYLKDFIFERVDSVQSVTILYAILVVLNLLTDGATIYRYVTFPFIQIVTETFDDINLGTQAFFYVGLVFIAIFFILTGISFVSVIVRQVWMYYLLFLQSLTPLYLRNLCTCFTPISSTMCGNSITMKVINSVVFAIFCLIIILFKNNAYYPFQNVTHLFSMKQQHISCFLLSFRTLICFIMYGNVFNDQGLQIKTILILAFIMFWKSRNSGYNHQSAKKIWNIYFYFVCWACFSLFLAYHINLIKDATNIKVLTVTMPFQKRVLFLLAYTLPFVLALPLFGTSTFQHDYWKNVFSAYDHQLQCIHGKQNVYIICNQFYHKIDSIRKSEMKFRDPQFNELWNLIKKHNQLCLQINCPLHQLDQYKVQSNDDFLQQKRFMKTIRNSLEYIRIILEKLKQKFPNHLEVNIQISYFYLIALKNKQKGMLSYNEIYSKKKNVENNENQTDSDTSEMSIQQFSKKKKGNQSRQDISKVMSYQPTFGQKFAVNYLKKKIDGMFSGQNKQVQSNLDNELSQFRQKIQVSVTMLAQFWSLLADPKCHLKKLYDLTNFLFPLKMSLQEDWEKIKTFKNIQSYNLYAKYLIRMFNDKQKGLNIFQQAKRIQYQIKNKQEIQLDDKGGQILQQAGIICMEFDGKNSGVMFQVNINAQKTFGYGKGQLLNRKVNDIMPNIYAVQHDRVLQNYQQTNYSTMMNKQRYVWGKSKDGHIFPFTILIKPILSYYSQSSSSQVYASLKRQTYIRQTIGVITDKNLIIQQYSTSALTIFPILLETLQNKLKTSNKYKNKHQTGSLKNTQSQLSIYDILPNFENIKQKVMIDNQQSEISFERSIKLGKNETDSFIEKSVFTIQISQIAIKTCGIIGYIIKLTKMGQSIYTPINKQKDNNKLSINQNKNNKSNFYNQFFTPQNQQQQIIDKKNPIKSFPSKVKFNLGFQQTSQTKKRKFIFSYDMAQKQKSFQKSMRKLQPKPKQQPNQQLSLHTSQNKTKINQQKIVQVLIDKILTKKQKQNQQKQMKYIGGYTQSKQIIDKFKIDTLTNFKNNLKVSQMQYQTIKNDFGIGIKTKRLQDNLIKQMRQQQIQFEFKNLQDQLQKQDQSIDQMQQVKPSQLSLILSKSSKNSFILFLKIISISLLLICSGACITQFMLIKQKQNMLLQKISKIKTINEIKTSVINIGYFTNYFTQFQQSGLFTYENFQLDINSLDKSIANSSFTNNAKVVYSDNSTDSFYLSFALNKLISQSNSLPRLKNTVLNKNNTSAFFLIYNTINGIDLSLNSQQEQYWNQYYFINQNIDRLCVIFITVLACFITLVIIIQNFLLRRVIGKKTQILEVFFEIPRVSCSLIQKECEKFILRLSTQNDEEQLDLLGNEDEQLEDLSKKGKKAQKKRSIVGQESTTTFYTFASVLFLLCLIWYQCFYLIHRSTTYSNMQTIVNVSKQYFSIQYSLFKATAYIDSYSLNPQIPINGSFSQNQTIDKYLQNLFNQIQQIRKNYFLAKQVLDSKFDQTVSQIMYGGISDHFLVQQEKQGMNSVISKSIENIKKTYMETKQNKTLPTKPHFQKTKLYQESMQIQWRKMTNFIYQAIQRYIQKNQSIYLWILIGACLLYLIILMIAWMKYYWSLEEKIIATEYILTFIPIDQINKNKKIAKYIKKEIVSRK